MWCQMNLSVKYYHSYTPGLLNTRPDSLTGSTLPHMLEYECSSVKAKDTSKEFFQHGVQSMHKPENPMEAYFY